MMALSLLRNEAEAEEVAGDPDFLKRASILSA